MFCVQQKQGEYINFTKFSKNVFLQFHEIFKNIFQNRKYLPTYLQNYLIHHFFTVDNFLSVTRLKNKFKSKLKGKPFSKIL